MAIGHGKTMDNSKQIKFNQWSKPKQPIFIYQMNKTLAEQKSDPQRRRRRRRHFHTAQRKKKQLHTHEYVKCMSVYMHVYLCTYVHVCAKSSVQTACS